MKRRVLQSHLLPLCLLQISVALSALPPLGSSGLELAQWLTERAGADFQIRHKAL